MKKEIKTHFKLQSFLNTYKEIVLEKDGANLGTIKQYKLKKNAMRLPIFLKTLIIATVGSL